MSELAFYCLDDQANGFVADVILGNGRITEECSSSRYYPDDSNIWQEFGPGVVGRYYYSGEWYMPYHGPWTNSCQESYDLSNANWTKTNVTAALTQTGMRGDANGATLLTATGANGTCIYQAVTAVSAAHGARFFLKRSVGTGTIEITLDNGVSWTDITTALDAASGWYEAVIDQTVANPQIGIRIGTSGDAVIVGNAELAVNPTAGVETPIAVLTWNTPIFTNGATGSVNEVSPYVSLGNHDNIRGLYYFEIAVATEDADHGLTDTYVFATDNGDEDGAVSNMANGNLWSQQNLDNLGATGGSTAQVTRPAVAGDKYQVCSWYDGDTDQAQYSLDGDLSTVQSDFGSFELASDDKLYLVRRQAGAALSTAVLVRNMRRYDLDDFNDGVTLELDLINPANSSGQQNIVRQSRWLDYETLNGNPWTNSANASAVRDIIGVDGAANAGCTVAETDVASFSRWVRQIFPLVGNNGPITCRILVLKDTNQARFPEFNLNLTGGVTRNAYVQINTQTGATALRTAGDTGTHKANSYNDDYWELLFDIDDDGGNTQGIIYCYPSYANTLGGAGVASLADSIGVGQVEIYLGLNLEAVEGSPPLYTPSLLAAPIPIALASKKPGYIDVDGQRNRRQSRYNLGQNDVSYRLGVNDQPADGTFDNKDRNRYL